MAHTSGGIGNVIPNADLLEMAMAYSRSCVLCAAARLGIADALGDEVRDVSFLAERCQVNPDAVYRLLRALADELRGGNGHRLLIRIALVGRVRPAVVMLCSHYRSVDRAAVAL